MLRLSNYFQTLWKSLKNYPKSWRTISFQLPNIVWKSIVIEKSKIGEIHSCIHSFRFLPDKNVRQFCGNATQCSALFFYDDVVPFVWLDFWPGLVEVVWQLSLQTVHAQNPSTWVHLPLETQSLDPTVSGWTVTLGSLKRKKAIIA